MRLSRYQLAPALLAVLYGALATLGQALHFLPGLDHYSPAAADCCCCHHHDETPPDEGQTDNSLPQPCDDCPVCEVLARAQQRAAEVPPLAVGELVFPALCGEIPAPRLEPIRLISVRGPPLTLAFAL